MRKACKYLAVASESVLLATALITVALFASIYSIKFLWKPIFASPEIQTFYPSNYTLLNSTRHVSGSLNDLQDDDNVCMTFDSYVSASSSTTKTNAFIAYSESGSYAPIERTWMGNTANWSSPSEMPSTGKAVSHVRVAYCTLENRSYEKIVVTMSDDYYVNAYIWNGTCWLMFNNIGYIGFYYRGFDVAYEKVSGRALIVYSKGQAGKIGYRIWDGTNLLGEYTLDLPTTGTVRWISLATCPSTRAGTADDNEIAMIYVDSTPNVYGYVWNGTAWNGMGQTSAWTPSPPTSTAECIAVTYEQTSGRAIFVWGDQNSDNYYRIWNGTTLSSSTQIPDNNTQGGNTYYLSLKPNPASNELMLTIINAGKGGKAELNGAYWNGSDWTPHAEHDSDVNTYLARCADFAWEPTGGKGLLVWGTTTNKISYKTFTAPNTWGSQIDVDMTGTHYLVQLRTNPRDISGDVKILGVILNSNYCLGAISWNGTTLTVIGASAISSKAATSTMEWFELEFSLFGEPTEFTCEVEFAGTSNMESWTQLVWSVNSASTADNVTVTFQLYNYQADEYPTSGDGYMTETIGTSNVTKNQTITINPTYFKDSSGNWKIKVKAVKSTSTQFNWECDSIKISVETAGGQYSLNLKIMDWDLTDAIANAYVIMNNGSDYWVVSDAGGWANFTGVSGTVTLKVQYFGFWVNGTFTVNVDSDKTIDVKCNLCDVTVNVRENVRNAKLLNVNVTVYNGTSIEQNKIKSGISNNQGKVFLANLPNATLTFTMYGGSTYTLTIGNTTQLIENENYEFTAICNQNYIETNSHYKITVQNT